MVADRRVKLVFAAALGRRLLRARGFSRCWFLLPPRARLVGDVAHAIRAEFAPVGLAAAALELRLEQVVLPPTLDARILRDHDELLVQSAPAAESDGRAQRSVKKEKHSDRRKRNWRHSSSSSTSSSSSSSSDSETKEEVVPLKKMMKEKAKKKTSKKETSKRHRSSSSDLVSSSASSSDSERKDASNATNKTEKKTKKDTKGKEATKRPRVEVSVAPSACAPEQLAETSDAELKPTRRRRRRQRNRKLAKKPKAKYGTMWKRPYEIVATILDAPSTAADNGPRKDFSDVLAKFPAPSDATVSADAFQSGDIIAYKTLTLCMETWQPVASEWLCGKVQSVSTDQVELLAMALSVSDNGDGSVLQWTPKEHGQSDAVGAIQIGDVSEVRYLDGPSYQKLQQPE